MIPVVDDRRTLANLLDDLNWGWFDNIIISCGDDKELKCNALNKVTQIRSPRGRGGQIAAAIDLVKTEWIWILHADVHVPRKAIGELRSLIGKAQWGAFRVVIDEDVFVYKKLFMVIAFLMNLRSRITSIFTGDQGMFLRRELLEKIDGFPRIPLMEDIESSRRLKRLCRGKRAYSAIFVSNRKWREQGILLTILRMWWYRVEYFFGTSPERLAASYYKNEWQD